MPDARDLGIHLRQNSTEFLSFDYVSMTAMTDHRAPTPRRGLILPPTLPSKAPATTTTSAAGKLRFMLSLPSTVPNLPPSSKLQSATYPTSQMPILLSRRRPESCQHSLESTLMLVITPKVRDRFPDGRHVKRGLMIFSSPETLGKVGS